LPGGGGPQPTRSDSGRRRLPLLTQCAHRVPYRFLPDLAEDLGRRSAGSVYAPAAGISIGQLRIMRLARGTCWPRTGYPAHEIPLPLRATRRSVVDPRIRPNIVRSHSGSEWRGFDSHDRNPRCITIQAVLRRDEPNNGCGVRYTSTANGVLLYRSAPTASTDIEVSRLTVDAFAIHPMGQRPACCSRSSGYARIRTDRRSRRGKRLACRGQRRASELQGKLATSSGRRLGAAGFYSEDAAAMSTPIGTGLAVPGNGRQSGGRGDSSRHRL